MAPCVTGLAITFEGYRDDDAEDTTSPRKQDRGRAVSPGGARRSPSRSPSRPPAVHPMAKKAQPTLAARETYVDALVVQAAADDYDPTMKAKAGRPAMVLEVRWAIRGTTPGEGVLTKWHRHHLETYSKINGLNRLNKWLLTQYVSDKLQKRKDVKTPDFFAAPIRCLVETIRILHCGTITRVFRGTAMATTQIQKLRDACAKKSVLQWSAFTSTSLSKETACDFAEHGLSEKKPFPVFFDIHRDPSHPTAANVSSLSEYPGEEEVLLVAGVRFKVVEVVGGYRPGGPMDWTHVVLKEHPIAAHK